MATFISQCHVPSGMSFAGRIRLPTEDHLRRASCVKMFGKSTSPQFKCSTNIASPFTNKYHFLNPHRRIRCGVDINIGETITESDTDSSDSDDGNVTESDTDSSDVGVCDIAVIGVGDGGSNAVDRMEKSKNIKGVHFFNTTCSEEYLISDALIGADMVILTAVMGGVAEKNWAPKIASMAKSLDILTIGIVTTPCSSDVWSRVIIEQQGIEAMRRHVDALIVIPNDKLLTQVPLSTHLDTELSKLSYVILGQCVRAISDIIKFPGLPTTNFRQVKRQLENAGSCMIGFGSASGEDRAIRAALDAFKSPLLDAGIETAKGIVLNITADSTLTVSEVNAAVDAIHKLVNPEAELLLGVVTDTSLSDEVNIALIATGCEMQKRNTELKIRDFLKEKKLRDPR